MIPKEHSTSQPSNPTLTTINILAKVGLMIALYYVTYSFYVGIKDPVPALGDSWDYHIPIAQTILNGSFLSPKDFLLPQWYYPGSAEAFHSLFLYLKIPLTLSNLIASLILLICLWRLGYIFKLSYYFSLLFALSFCTLNVLVRWFNAVSIDVWIGVFYCLSLILLLKQKPRTKDYLYLGLTTGMLIGSKYTAILYLIPLTILYGQRFMTQLNIKRFVAFIIPFSLTGLFWYVRNYLAVGNPLYPLPFFHLPGSEIFGGFRVWNIALTYPLTMMNSIFAEYKLWLIAIVINLLIMITIKRKLTRLMLLGLINLCLYFTFPTSAQPWIMVSSLRYSYPAFIPLILSVFVTAKHYHHQNLLGYFALANALMVTSFSYYPKLVLIYFPLSLLSFWLLDHFAPKSKDSI